jgi:uncharacterized protein YidB (DUF937 family)
VTAPRPGPGDVCPDPAGVIAGLVASLEPALSRAVIEEIVAGAAGGRAKQRRLASALLERPAVLTDGRSPAPQAVATMLIALRDAGAAGIAAPACAGCAKPLRTFARRGQDWFCHTCGPSREPCAACGSTRTVTSRDRDGKPRCGQCPAGNGEDPVAIVAGLVAAIDPAVPAGVVAAAVHAAAPNDGQRLRLAWALQDRPGLLTGAGAQSPVPSVLRLIGSLADAGAAGIVRPPCPHCGRVIALVKPRDGLRLCRNCVARSRAVPCARCTAVREPAARDTDGGPLCAGCLITDPASQETCAGCGRRRPVSTRTPDGPLCPSCRPGKTLTCSICGRLAPGEISKVTGQPWCKACQQRWARCAGCGRTRPVRGGTASEPLCSTCLRPGPGFWSNCPGCGQSGRLSKGPCARCTLDQRLRDLLGDADGEIRPGLQALYQALLGTGRPDTAATWLGKDVTVSIVRELRTGNPLTHELLDTLPGGKPVEHLRSVLVAIGTLPARDEQMTRLEQWVTAAINGRPDPGEQELLRRYAIWHLLRRLRRRIRGEQTTHNQLVGVRQHVRAATVLLDWLAARDLTLATCGQGDLENWLTSDDATHRREAGHFVRWARTQKLTSLDFPATKWGGPARVLDTEERWDQARRLLHDTTLRPEDRLAGLLVLLYAQWPSAISRLTLDHLQLDDDTVQLRLGREPITLPDPLASLTRHLIATRHGHAVLGDKGASRWLFPGGQPGRPISSSQLTERLRQIGLHPGQDRSTALFQLAADLPAAILARMLGIHITVAVAWQRASSGDWTSYAAHVSRRTRP